MRDLCRARDDARADRQRCRHRLGKLLLRRGLHYPGRAWTQAHRRWVNGLTWPHPADRVAVDDYLLAIDHLEARLMELDAQLATVATTEPYREPVGWLRCFRGIDTLTAMLLLAELHDVQRFPTARALMAYLGLVPGEHSSGERHRRGPITKTGNTLARRLVVEAAWHYRHRPGVSRTLAQRRSGQPPRVIALADKGSFDGPGSVSADALLPHQQIELAARVRELPVDQGEALGDEPYVRGGGFGRARRYPDGRRP